MDNPESESPVTAPPEPIGLPADPPSRAPRRSLNLWRIARWAISLALAFSLGIGSGYAVWGREAKRLAQVVAEGTGEHDHAGEVSLAEQVNPSQGYPLGIAFGDIGPKLIAAGAIDLDKFEAVFVQAGHPLSAEQIRLVAEGGDAPVVITRGNSHFLLNFLWAVGLTNSNSILTKGAMTEAGGGEVGGFASTGGWTIARRPIKEVYASASIVPLTREQQARVEEVAGGVYRPCCNNPTSFPDCNHGMAMLGLLQILASQGASTDEMFTAAKYVNAFWFPQQTLETASFFMMNEGLTFDRVKARDAVSANFSSKSGSGLVRQWLEAKGGLPQTPGQGGGCGT